MVPIEAPTILSREHREPVGERGLLLGREGQARDHRRDVGRRGIASIEGHVSGRSEQHTARRLGADHRRKGHHRLAIVPGFGLSIRFLVAKLAPQVEDVHRLLGRRRRNRLALFPVLRDDWASAATGIMRMTIARHTILASPMPSTIPRVMNHPWPRPLCPGVPPRFCRRESRAVAPRGGLRLDTWALCPLIVVRRRGEGPGLAARSAVHASATVTGSLTSADDADGHRFVWRKVRSRARPRQSRGSRR